MKRVTAIVAIVALLLVSATASAQDATEWKKRGDDAMDANRAAEALDAYRHAQAIAPSPALDYNIGRALLAIGDFVAALDSFEKFEREAPEELRQRTHRLGEIMKELRAKIATLTIVAPPGARILVRGSDVKEPSVRVNPGSVDVRVEADDHEPFTTTVTLAPGATHSLNVELRRLPTTGQLTIVTHPDDASITVDGVSHGPTGIALGSERKALSVPLELKAGLHTIEATAKGHRPTRKTVFVQAGTKQRMDIFLDAERVPVTSRWWFWGVLGAVAAGATVAIIAGTSEHGPEDGSLGTFRVP